MVTPEITNPLTKAVGDGRAFVRGAVIPENNLEIREGLGHDTLQGLAQMFRAVVAVHDYRNQRSVM